VETFSTLLRLFFLNLKLSVFAFSFVFYFPLFYFNKRYQESAYQSVVLFEMQVRWEGGKAEGGRRKAERKWGVWRGFVFLRLAADEKCLYTRVLRITK